MKLTFWLRFFAGFCSIANGAYVGFGALTHDGDGGDMIRSGSPVAALITFALVAVPVGLAAWHRLGAQFGVGDGARPIGWHTALASLAVLFTVVAAETIAAGFGKSLWGVNAP
jgi:hypothetical protein